MLCVQFVQFALSYRDIASGSGSLNLLNREWSKKGSEKIWTIKLWRLDVTDGPNRQHSVSILFDSHLRDNLIKRFCLKQSNFRSNKEGEVLPTRRGKKEVLVTKKERWCEQMTFWRDKWQYEVQTSPLTESNPGCRLSNTTSCLYNRSRGYK